MAIDQLIIKIAIVAEKKRLAYIAKSWQMKCLAYIVES